MTSDIEIVKAALYYANREVERVRDERDALAARWAKVEALFAGGPDTPCRTTWRGNVEWVQVPMDDLRDALDGSDWMFACDVPGCSTRFAAHEELRGGGEPARLEARRRANAEGWICTETADLCPEHNAVKVPTEVCWRVTAENERMAGALADLGYALAEAERDYERATELADERFAAANVLHAKWQDAESRIERVRVDLDFIIGAYVGPPIPHEAIAIVLDMVDARLRDAPGQL